MVQATQVVAPGKIEFLEIPVPALKPGHVLVRTLLVSLCGSDVRMLHFSHPEQYPFPVGTTGHEVLAVVEAVDAPGSDIKVGDLVIALQADHTGMSEVLLVPAEDVLVLPEAGRPDDLLMAQQLGTVIYACKRLPNIIGTDVVIIGQGSAGLFFNAMCRRLGAEQVIGMDIKDARVAAGLKLGATHTFNNSRFSAVEAVRELTHGAMPDLVIEAAGEAETINLAIELVRKQGCILFFGLPRSITFRFDYEMFFEKCCQGIANVGAAREPGRVSTRQAVDIISRGEIDVSCLITHRLPLARLNEAYELATTCADDAIKVVVEMPGYRTWQAGSLGA